MPQVVPIENERVDKRKRDETDIEPHKTRGIKRDYRKLHDPFSEEEDELEESATLTDEQALAAAAEGDEPKLLKEAKTSPEWPEWEKAIKAELDQHQKMETWVLVDKPADTIPIANKWVFARKRNKEGQIVKYKARLVAKGYAQRPGYDFFETHSPVVRLETIRAILALATSKKMLIQQMDVKGAYLNGVLEERVYKIGRAHV